MHFSITLLAWKGDKLEGTSWAASTTMRTVCYLSKNYFLARTGLGLIHIATTEITDFNPSISVCKLRLPGVDVCYKYYTQVPGRCVFCTFYVPVYFPSYSIKEKPIKLQINLCIN